MSSEKYFLPYQCAWLDDNSPLKLAEKARQIGWTYCDSYDSVRKAAVKGGLDVYVMSRDEELSKAYIRHCKRWANVLRLGCADHGEQVFDDDAGKPCKVQVLTFASTASIYALSSNPDAIVGKSGHVKLDEFALQREQRDLYAVAKQVTQWGGSLSVISTHRGIGTVFNALIQDIKEHGNPMGWSFHSTPIQAAVDAGLVEKINAAKGTSETREEWLARVRRECIDSEQWAQEYCCIPADESSAFITYEMIRACEDASALKGMQYLVGCKNPLYLGADIARTTDLTVFDVEELVGDVLWERMRVEMRGQSFDAQEAELYRLLSLPRMRRACIDATGLGMQLAERAVKKFHESRVEAVRFSAPVKEELAYPMRSRMEGRLLRFNQDDKLTADLRGVKKETTESGNIRFVGESADSHCDRFWAKALAVHAAAQPGVTGGFVLGNRAAAFAGRRERSAAFV